MTWTPTEVEQILREQWEGSEDLGGYANAAQRDHYFKDLKEEFGNDLDGYTLIGETSWFGYEEGSGSYLFIKDADQSLWEFERGNSVMGGNFGLNFIEEVSPITIQAWMEKVEVHRQMDEQMTGD